MSGYNNKNMEKHLSTIYWFVVSLFYLSFSIINDSWNQSWLILPIAAIIFALFTISKNPIND